MKGAKKLKIADRKSADLECQPHDGRIEINTDKQTAYFAALVEAWLQTRMEKDKSLLMLAAGGVGVLVTLLTTTGIHSPFVGSLFAGALICFLASILLAISIFGRNAGYIHCLINNKTSNERDLQRRDTWMYWSFVIGVTLTISIGFFSGISKYRKEEASMNERKPATVDRTGVPPTDKRSFSGLSELAPTGSSSAGQGQQPSGSNQGSSGNNQSSGSNQSSGQSSGK